MSRLHSRPEEHVLTIHLLTIYSSDNSSVLLLRPEGDMNDHRDMLQMYITPPFDVVEAHAMAAKLGSRYSEQFKGLHQF